MKRTIEPFWWALFSSGGMISALFMPVLFFIFGIAVPLGLVNAPEYEQLLTITQNPMIRLFIFGLISLSLFHWAHRFRFTLYDGLKLKHLEVLIAVLCYGSAIFGSVFAGYSLLAG